MLGERRAWSVVLFVRSGSPATRLRAKSGWLGVRGLEDPGHRAVHGHLSGGRFETLDPDVPELAHELGRDLS